jgi:alditol oxidase
VVTTWAGSYVFGAAQVVHPRSLEELQEVVAGASRVRALGSRHSFTDLADTEGTLVCLDELDPGVVLDAERGEVTVGGGATCGLLAETLHAQGHAFTTMASLPHISVAGAVATGTHGSSDRNGSLSSLVRRLEVVTPGGELRTVERGDTDFPGWVVALGALGVVHRVTLDVVPTFEIGQRVYTGLPWERYVEDLDAVMGSAYSVSAFIDWTSPEVGQLWVKSRPEDPEPEIAGVQADDTMHMIPGANVEAITQQLGLVGPWHERLPHFRAAFTPSAGEELQTEYFVPRRWAREALQAVRPLGPQLAPLLQVTELRTFAADDLWLSGAYEEDVLGVHFTWFRDWDGVHAVLPRIEEALAPYAARPHWGKCFTTDPATVESVFPRLDDFRRLRDQVDPEDVCGNRWLDRVLGARDRAGQAQKTL